MDITNDAESIAKLMDFLKAKSPSESLRDSVVRFYMELGAKVGVRATWNVGVIVNGAEMGAVDCALASPASIAVTFAEEKNDALLGLWKIAELGPRTGILVLSSTDPSIMPEVSAIARKSYLLRSSSVHFVILDIEGGRAEKIQRNSIHSERKKIIKGKRQAYKKQD